MSLFEGSKPFAAVLTPFGCFETLAGEMGLLVRSEGERARASHTVNLLIDLATAEGRRKILGL